jgi:uroporphyrin-III C-methyltransferase
MVALLTAQDCTGHIHLIIGSGPLAASRCAKSLDVGAHPILVAPADADLHYTLRSSIDQGDVGWTQREFQDEDLSTLGRQEIGGYVDAVFVTTHSRDTESKRISDLCKRWRVPVNVVDAPELCTFTLLSTHSDGPLQIGITTSGRGCKLSSRIRREIASSLPTGLGDAVERLGTLRKRIWEEDSKMQQEQTDLVERPEVEDEEAAAQRHTFNALVKEGDKSAHVSRTRRMRWLSQICEYWPLARLAAVTDSDVSAILDAYRSNTRYPISPSREDQPLDILPHKRHKGNMTLAGSGPGHPSLLTLAAHRAIKSANFILADKLVPAEVLALIPRRTPVHIARKFPGNADAAQEEMHELALQALERGENVLRLKQGDPYLYGRGAEEVEFFQRHGFEVRVIPGVTSSLSAPLFAGIPVTHRGVADEVLICTGTGRKGAAPDPPAHRKGRTVVFLMALHRLESLVSSLGGAEWPTETPCAVIERASCPDQRVIRTKLEYVCQAVEEEGSRPPGLLVVGEACEVLHKLAEGRRWVTEEGFRGLNRVGGDDVGLSVLADIEVTTKEPLPQTGGAGMK